MGKEWENYRCSAAMVFFCASLAFVMILQTTLVVSQPLSFLGDVSKMTPLECIGAQCGLAGVGCAKTCPESFDETSCRAACSQVLDRCLQSRCFFSLHKVGRAKSACCEDNKFGCVWNDGTGCVDSAQQDCGRNKGFNASFTACVNANLTVERGNAALNVSSVEIPLLPGNGSCLDSTQCIPPPSRVCYKGTCVDVSLVTPVHRHAVECLDDIDCPMPKVGRFVCLNSSCVIPPEGFCRKDTDCPPNWLCATLNCLYPEILVEQPPPPPSVEPATVALQQWALGKPGIMARISSVAGSASYGTKEPVPGHVFSVRDSLASPPGMAVELLLADGTHAFLGPGSAVSFSSITAEGSRLYLDVSLQKGEVVLDVPNLQEVQHYVSVMVGTKGSGEEGGTINAVLSQGVASLVRYSDGASKLAVIENTVTLGGAKVLEGQQVVITPEGNVLPPVPIPMEEMRRLQVASKVPMPVSPPPFRKAAWFERYGILAAGVLLVLVAAVWIFFRKRPKKGEKEPDGSSRLDWPELEK